MKERILVTGATGNVGSALARLLVDAGRSVVVGVRNLAKARDWFEDRAQVRLLDLTMPETFPDAVAGVDRAFLMAPPGDLSAPERIAGVLDALKRAGANHAVVMTAAGVEHAPDTMPLRRLETYALASGLDATILRPNWFMQNFATGPLGDSIRGQAAMFVPAGEGRSAFIDARDIAAVASLALTSESHRKRALPLTGSEALSYGEVAEVLTQATGRSIRYVPISDEDTRASMLGMGVPAEVVEYFLALYGRVRAGDAAAVSSCVLEITGRPPRTFQSFAHEFAPAWT